MQAQRLQQVHHAGRVDVFIGLARADRVEAGGRDVVGLLAVARGVRMTRVQAAVRHQGQAAAVDDFHAGQDVAQGGQRKSALAAPLNSPPTTIGATSDAIITSLPLIGYEYGSVK
jgi:hypothetical protein